MCVYDPKRVDIKGPITAYKVMAIGDKRGSVQSIYEGSMYQIGETYDAECPCQEGNVGKSNLYDSGFHAYVNSEDAYGTRVWLMLVVEVELFDIAFEGSQWEPALSRFVPVYVANKCRFVSVLPFKIDPIFSIEQSGSSWERKFTMAPSFHPVINLNCMS